MFFKHANKNQNTFTFIFFILCISNKQMKKDIYSIYTLIKYLPLLYLHDRNWFWLKIKRIFEWNISSSNLNKSLIILRFSDPLPQNIFFIIKMSFKLYKWNKRNLLMVSKHFTKLLQMILMSMMDIME